MDDPALGIVQTPQYFRSLPGQTWVERAAAATLEIFYRSVQQARDRFGSALCVGSNAVYRRTALEPSEGCFLIPYAEDSHTGLAARKARVRPQVPARSRWPRGCARRTWTRSCASSTAGATARPRWCGAATCGGWRCRCKSRLPYIAGWMWNFTTALRTLILPLIPITLLAFLPGEIQLRNAILLIPSVIVGSVLYPLWHNSRWTWAVWPVAIAVGWAQTLGLWDYARGKVMTWQPTIGPVDAPRRFRKCVVGWNGTLALAWLGLAAWRIAETGSPRFLAVAAFGVLNAVVVGRIAFPGKVR